MRRALSSITLFAAATMLSATSFASDSDRAVTLKAAELARFEAQVNADAKALGLALDDQLEYVHSNGDLDTKASFIGALVSGKRDYIATTANIQSVRILGDVGIIRGAAKVTVASDGKTQDLSIGYTDVWVWKANRWQMTAWRSAKDPAPAAAVPMPPSTPKVN
jgi:hypothetical protein